MINGYIFKLLLPLSMILALSASCKRDNRRELLIINQQLDFEIPPGLNTLDTHFFVIDNIESQLKKRLNEQGFELNDVIAIEARNAVLTSVFQDYNLDFIHRVSIHIFNPFDRTEFYYRDPIPFGNKTEIDLIPGIANLLEWVERDRYGIEVRLDLRQISPSAIPMRLLFNLRVLSE